jgi:hypothetical protein
LSGSSKVWKGITPAMSDTHVGGQIQNEILVEEHDGANNAKRVTLASGATLYAVVNTGAATGNVTVSQVAYSFYQQSSLVSGYVFYGLANPGSNPTTANFRIQRETLNSGSILFANGAATFSSVWSAASLASITYL